MLNILKGQAGETSLRREKSGHRWSMPKREVRIDAEGENGGHSKLLGICTSLLSVSVTQKLLLRL